MQYVDSWYCWRKENILQLCFFVSTLPSTIFDWRYFTTILQSSMFPDIWLKVFWCNIAEKYFSLCLIESILLQYQREKFVPIFEWKYFRATLQRNKSEIFCGLCARMSPFKALSFFSFLMLINPIRIKKDSLKICFNHRLYFLSKNPRH